MKIEGPKKLKRARWMEMRSVSLFDRCMQPVYININGNVYNPNSIKAVGSYHTEQQ